MVNQNIQQIRPELFSSLSGNVGPVYCFRVGPEDASRMCGADLAPMKEEVRDALISLPDYSCVVRKRPHGEDVAGKPILFEPFPRVGESLCGTKEVVDYMKREMEEKYGGAHEATTLIYRSPAEEIARQVQTPGSPSRRSPGGYSRRATSSCSRTPTRSSSPASGPSSSPSTPGAPRT